MEAIARINGVRVEANLIIADAFKQHKGMPSETEVSPS